MDLIKALEVSSNPYFSLLAGDCLEHPDDLSHAALSFGYGKRTGIDLTAEISGRVPSDLSKNRNGLYAMAIGQHSFVVTPLQMAVMLSSIANGGQILKPRIVHLVGEKGAIPPVNLSFKKEKLPSFSYVPKEVRWEVPMPDPIRSLLIEGMHRMIKRIHFSAIWELSHLYEGYPEAISDFLDLKDQCVGKSSTAESVEFVDLDLKLGTVLYNHIGFGGIIYERESKKGEERFVFKDRLGKPELVVIVYARYGGWGKDVVPLAMQVANKWREIKRKNNFSSGF